MTNLTDEAPNVISFSVGGFGPEWYFPDVGGLMATVEWAGGTGECDGDWGAWGCHIYSAAKRTRLPANAVAVPAADVDVSDNQDGFAVLVAAFPKDDGGGGGGLPVTGPQAGLITGAGLAMLTVGGILLLLARRRTRLPHA